MLKKKNQTPITEEEPEVVYSSDNPEEFKLSDIRLYTEEDAQEKYGLDYHKDQAREEEEKRLQEAEEQKKKEEEEEAWKVSHAEEIAEKQRKQKSFNLACIVVAALVALFLLAKLWILPMVSYNQGVAELEAKEYEAAYDHFYAAGSYGDASAKAEECLARLEQQTATNADMDKLIHYGSYEQDNDLENGTESIKWMIAAREEDRILLVSWYGLDVQPYVGNISGGTWDVSDIREWLNGEFLSSAFTDAERSLILNSDIVTEDNPDFGTEGGEDTVDQVFLLSVDEANEYLSASDRICKATPYAIAKGAYAEKENDASFWWLRSPGYYKVYAAICNPDGATISMGANQFNDTYTVRPAIWIEIAE